MSFVTFYLGARTTRNIIQFDYVSLSAPRRQDMSITSHNNFFLCSDFAIAVDLFYSECDLQQSFSTGLESDYIHLITRATCVFMCILNVPKKP